MAREDDYPGLALSPSGAAPSAFIVHHTAGRGDPASVVNFWKKQGKGYGSQYIMDRNGIIHDTAKEFGYTGTNEILNGTGPGKGLSNSNTVGMEIVANDDKDVTPQQASAFAQFIAARYPNTPLFGHGQVNPGHKEATEGATALNAALALRSQSGQPVLGTAINTPNAPVAGVLASQEAGPESAGQGAPAAASSGPLDTRQLIYNKLIGAGLQPHQAMGALYGLGGESATFNTGAYNPNDPGGSIGIGQWNGPRRAALEAFAKNQGTSVTDPNTQADFLIDELANPKAATYQPGVLDAMKTAKDAAAATNTWVAKYERPKVNNWQQRFDAGPARVGSLDQNNNFAIGSGPASNTTTAPGTAVAAAPATAVAAADKPLWQKAFDVPTDAQGNPVAGGKSPFQQAVSAFSGQDKDKGSSLAQFKQAQEEEAPQGAVRNQAGPAPGARNTSPMGGALLPSVPQTYGQTLNSFSAPLTWNSAPPKAPTLPAGGQQGPMFAQTPGMTLTSFQAPQGIGYGVDPNIGYGYG